MKKLISIVLMFTLMVALTGCGSSTQAQTTDTQAVAEAQEETAETPEAEDPETEPAETEQQTDEAAVSETEAEPEVKDPVPAEHSDVLVAYFGRTFGRTGCILLCHRHHKRCCGADRFCDRRRSVPDPGRRTLYRG